jgi:hypothetical protein
MSVRAINRNAIVRSRRSTIEKLPPKLMLRQESLAPRALDGELHRHPFSRANRRTQQLLSLAWCFFLDARLFFASVLHGHGVAQYPPRG